MKHTAVRIAAALALAATTLTPALAQTSSDGQWLVRARAVHLDPANKDNIDGLDVGINTARGEGNRPARAGGASG